MYIFINGKVVEQGEAAISPFDHGYMYGLGAFETFRIYNRHPFLLDDHLSRLKESLDHLHIEYNLDKDSILVSLEQLLDANELDHAYIRFNISAGIGEVGLQTDPYIEPTVIIYIKPLSAQTPLVEKEGVFLETKRNSPEGSFRLKSHHYLNNILGKREIGSNPNREGLFLTEEGYVAEGVVSNLFWVKNNIVYTPSVETGILNGVTRQFILKLLNRQGIETKIGFYKKEDLLDASEVFVTNSIQEIVPLNKVDGQAYVGNRGTVTLLLRDLYARYRNKLWTRDEL